MEVGFAEMEVRDLAEIPREEFSQFCGRCHVLSDGSITWRASTAHEWIADKDL